MKIYLIAAMDDKRVIGKDGDIPWKLSGDLKRFKKITMGYPIIMGRKTYESIGRPLPGRENIVLTRQKDYCPEGVTVYNFMEQIYNRSFDSEALFVIGGEEVYGTFLPMADRLYLTIVKGEHEGDAFFPEFDKNDFIEIERELGEGEPVHNYIILERKV